MTCNEVLELMLEADAEELEGRGAGAVAQHVRECARCRAVAQAIVSDSQLLAVSVRRSAPVDLTTFAARTRFSRRALIGGAVAALAASVLFVVLVQNGMRAYVQADKSFAVVTTVPQLPPGVGPARPGIAVVDVATPGTVSVTLSTPATPLRFADVQPVPAVRYQPPAGDQTAPAASVADTDRRVRVRPHAGRRATIMRGHNPKVTVVWLY
jgi:predicted anti-sigma-YlaC factor YlaD